MVMTNGRTHGRRFDPAETGKAGPGPIPLHPCRLAVFDPSPALTITVERGPEIHIHAGGQGFWVARMASRLGADVRLCVPLGGETGQVLGSLLRADGITPVAVETEEDNGAYVHSRADGGRTVVAETASPALSRHELDDLYGATLSAGLDSDLMLLTGPRNPGVVPADTYGRLTADLKLNGRLVLADLSDEAMWSAIHGEADLIKASDEDLAAMGILEGEGIAGAVATAQRLRAEGAANVLITRRQDPAVASLGERLLAITGPRFEPLDPHGAGDSLFAGIGVGLGGGLAIEDALRVGMAAGALNVTRHGLGTGHAREVSALAPQVRVEAVDPAPAPTAGEAAAS